MQTEKQISLECQEHLPTGNSSSDEQGLLQPSSSNHGAPEKPGIQIAKRPTRPWAAWTREEEESFFTALRQVGKNFEKITSRVQSKNKDQVRHYYYRLVRRMNKLLGPGFSLDAKNSKDTNAAMLRWWSLLEKYSCKASKLHLKPRRFKIFIEALEHQLLKDRKKNVRRRISQGENCPSLCPTPSPQQNKQSVNETRAVKLVLVDSQNIQKAGSGKGSVVRHNPNIGVNKSSNKGDSSPNKAPRQRRKTGALSAAALKKWKAAIAGVSLVADAAEHLERTACGTGPEMCSISTHSSLEAAACRQGGFLAESCLRPSKILPPPLPSISSNVPPESSELNYGKFKLQLFPIDDGTKTALEIDKHNPYLELTLSTRKKISSVMEHLDKKWGSSSVACGELMLFPYGAERENVLKYQRWTRESFVTAADVYAVIGNPPVFRLRYGWISATELQSATSAAPADISDKCVMHEYSGKNSLVDLTPASGPWSNGTFGREVENKGVGNNAAMSAGEWADSLTNISVGDLLAEVSDVDADCVEAPLIGGSHHLEDFPFSCDSFDAAIAAHILSHQNKMGFQLAAASHSSSILDAEETCDAFSFQKRFSNTEQVQSSSVTASSPVCEDTFRPNSVGSDGFLEDSPKEEEMMDAAAQGDLEEDPSEPNSPENSSRDLNALTDISWPDSLGPLDLDAPPCRYYNQDLILSDSLGGLSRLIASSLDAFQNCSFFYSEKKETTSATEAQGKASSDNRIDGGSN